MGTDKASSERKVSSTIASRNWRKRKSMFRTKTKTKLVISGWETWEDQLILALLKEGKNDKQISKHLPDRSERACTNRRRNLLKAQSQDVSQEDALASPAPRKKYWSKTWEPWEDQIVITNHNAGKSWMDISKMLPPRSATSLRHRWKLFLAPSPQENVSPETQSRDTLRCKTGESVYSLDKGGRSAHNIPS